MSSSDDAAAADDADTDGPFKEEIDVTSHTSYNEAVLLFQMKQYGKVLAILERLYKQIEPIEEALATRICFLLLDVYFAMQMPEKAGPVVQHLEKVLQAEVERTGEGGADGGSEPPDELLANALSMVPTAGSSAGDQMLYKLTGEAFTLLLHYYKARLYLLSRSMKSSKREIKSALASSQQGGAGAGSVASPALFLKADLEYLRQNYRKSIKLLHGCHKGGGSDSTVLYLNNMGCAHFCMVRHTATSCCSLVRLTLFCSELMGTAGLLQGKHNASSFYFLKALRENNKGHLETGGGPGSAGSKMVALPGFAKDRAPSLQYNLGLQLLLVEQPEHAFACFQEASLLYYNKPRLWLRMAECCISAHVRKVAESEKAGSKSDVVRAVVGEGRARRVVLPTGGAAGGDRIRGTKTAPRVEGIPQVDTMSHHPHPSPREDPGVLPGAAAAPRFGSMSLEHAAKCLRNCLYLLDHAGSGAAAAAAAAAASSTAPATTSTGGAKAGGLGGAGDGASSSSGGGGGRGSGSDAASAGGGDGGDGPGSEEAKRPDPTTVKQAALVSLAYVSLCLDDPLSSLSAATDLLHVREVTPGNRYLAHTYAAEALCMLNRPHQAEKHLSPSLVSEENNPDERQAGRGGAAAAATAKAAAEVAAAGGGGGGFGPGGGPGGANGYRNFQTSGGRGQFSVFSGSCVSDHSKCILYCNLAGALLAQVTSPLSPLPWNNPLTSCRHRNLSLQDKLQQAQALITQALEAMPSAAPALMALTYLELRKGNTEAALQLLKSRRPTPAERGGGGA